jgi:hypothetical protein
VKRILTASILSAVLATSVSGQTAWDSPALMSPSQPSGFSLFLLEPAGGDLGAMFTLRHGAGPVGLGYRASLAEESGPDGDLAVSGGIDVSGMLGRQIEGSELDIMWWAGGGMSVGSDWIISAPAGIMLGWSGSGDGVIFNPYFGAHLVMDLTGNDGDALNLDGVLDLGLDLVLSSGWMIRVGAGLGDREALAAGFRIPTGS